jgi:hypothetical protein
MGRLYGAVCHFRHVCHRRSHLIHHPARASLGPRRQPIVCRTAGGKHFVESKQVLEVGIVAQREHGIM